MSVQLPGVCLMAGITARKASEPDERWRIALVERQLGGDMLLELDGRAVILSPEEAEGLAELLTDMADRVRSKAEARP